MHTLHATEIETPIGTLFAVAHAQKDEPAGICLLEFAEVTDRLKRHSDQLQTAFKTDIQTSNSAELTPSVTPLFDQLKTQLSEYFSGKRKQFAVPINWHGTAFQQQAWQALQHIPYGETRSYQAQAKAIGNTKAVRAVAGANNRNKISILVPCHRVIGKNGTLTGYGGELWRKQYLLDLEQKNSV